MSPSYLTSCNWCNVYTHCIGVIIAFYLHFQSYFIGSTICILWLWTRERLTCIYRPCWRGIGFHFPLPVNVLTAHVDGGNRPLPTPGRANKSAWTPRIPPPQRWWLLHTHTYRHTGVCTEPRSLTGGGSSGITTAHCSKRQAWQPDIQAALNFKAVRVVYTAVWLGVVDAAQQLLCYNGCRVGCITQS